MPNERLAAFLFRLARDELPSGMIEEHLRVVEEAHDLPSMERRVRTFREAYNAPLLGGNLAVSYERRVEHALEAVDALRGQRVIYEQGAAVHLGAWARVMASRLLGGNP